MTKKSLLWVGVLAMCSLGIASAKSYDIVLSSPAMIGHSKLAAGDYSLKVQGSNAVFTNTDNRKSVTAEAKIQNAAKKYDATAVEMSKKSDGEHIEAIELGGSRTRLEFN